MSVGVIYTLGVQPDTTIAFNYVRDAAHVWAGVGFHHGNTTNHYLIYID